MGRIRKTFVRSGRVLAAFAALGATACGSRVDQVRTNQPESPSPSATASPAGAASPAPTAQPASAEPSPSATTPPPSPSPSPARPSPTPPPASPSEPSPTIYVTAIPGRPLRQRRRLLRPSVGGGDAPMHPDHQRLAALPDPLRAELHRRWLDAARLEHASVPAFAEIALLLAAVGAPLDLVVAAHEAALDEVEHTRLSYALANAYGGTAYAPGGLPRLLGRRVGGRFRGPRAALRRIAVESLRDGCLSEGYAGALAAAGAGAAADPAVRDVLATIARDEAAHAELSWRVLGWCLHAGGPPVRAAVARALRELPGATAAGGTAHDLAAHGWPDPAEAAEVFAGVRAEVAARAAGLLALAGA